MSVKYLLLSPLKGILAKCPKLILSMRYYKQFHRRINLKEPTLFYDKIFWNSLNKDTRKWSELADKYLVRSYVVERCGSGLLTELYGVYDRASDINYDELPNSFVMKTNNGCASNIIVRNKELIDKAYLNKKLDYWLKLPYGEITGQMHYSRIVPMIIVEELLMQKDNPDSSLIDYKFYCFKGKPCYCMVMTNRKFNTHDMNLMMYDMDWNEHREFFEPNKLLNPAPRPKSLSRMIEIASSLSRGFDYVRVDLYDVNGEPKFGEMTFMPGTDVGLTIEKQKELGELLC